MAADVTVKVDPADMALLDKALKRVPLKVRHNLERKAMRKSLAEVRKKARDAAPKRSGKLRKSITAKVSLKRNIGLLSGRIYVSRKHKVYYSHLVEWGTDKTPGHLFMSRVFEGEKDNIVRNFHRSIRTLLAAPKI